MAARWRVGQGVTTGLLVAVAVACAGAPSTSRQPRTAGSADDRIRVLYPRGECETGLIDVEIFDRDTSTWRPHPEHPRVPADQCQEEVAGMLLQEIRYRCTDPERPARASAWVVGVDVFDPVDAERCGDG